MPIQLFTHPNHKPKLPKSTAAKKAKGRRLQDFVRETFRRLAPEVGVEPEDIKSALMGSSGVDIVFSTTAQRVFGLDVECKNVERLNAGPTFWKHYEKYASRPTLKVLIHKVNHKDALITLKFADFMPLYRKALLSNVVPGQAVGEHDVA